MNEPSDAVKKALAMLGLARAAGVLSIGQDDIREELRRGKKLVIFVTEDAGASAMRRFIAAEERGAEIQAGCFWAEALARPRLRPRRCRPETALPIR